MNGKFLLDTNAVIRVFAGEPAVAGALKEAREVFLSTIVLGELYFGARKSRHVQRNLARIDEFAASSALLTLDVETVRKYGEVKNGLRQKGRPIPENDIWVAAIALQHGLTILTRDDHFSHIDGLSTTGWTE